MVIFINDEPKEVKTDASIEELLTELELSSAPGTAVAVNNQIVLQNNRTSTILSENDKVLIITAAKGG